MNPHQLTTCICLGAGGPRPGAWIFGDNGADPHRILELPEGHSAYAIDMDLESGRLAVGTRGGRVNVFTWPGDMGAGEASSTLTLVQGAPLLSVCLMGGSQLASSDTAGRCLLWRAVERPTPPVQLPVPGGPICSLLNLEGRELVGLSANGEVVFWSLPDGELVRMIKGTPPPQKTALVQLTRWPAAGALVHPGDRGQLVTYSLENGRFTDRTAHEGEFFFVAVSGDQLLTIGRTDRQLKVWQADHNEPFETFEAPTGIISGAVLSDTPRRLLLVTDAGTASTYRCDGGALRRERQLDGQGGRVVAGPPPQARVALHERKRLAEAQGLRERILEMIERGDPGDAEALHAELIGLGFEEVSLALRARNASVRNDPIAELGARHRLASILPKGDRKAVRAFQRYAAALESTWQMAEAHEVHESLSTTGKPSEPTAHLARCAEILAGDNWVAEPDIPLATIVRAASVLGKRFRGRWLIRMLKPVPFQHGRVSADMIAARYDKVRTEHVGLSLPPAKTATLHWVSRDQVRQVETVTIGRPLGGTHDGQHIAVQVLHDGIQPMIVPAVLLDASPSDADGPPDEHNDRVLMALGRMEQSDLAGSWQRRVLHFVLLAVRRLLTEAAAESTALERV